MENMFEGKGTVIGNIRHITPNEAYECCKKGAVIIDVREEFMSHVKTFKIDNLYVFPMSKFENEVHKLPKNTPLIFADATGVKSKHAADYAYLKGVENFANMAGGLLDWERDGLPTITYQKLKVMGSNKCEFIDKKDLQ